jgi:predicted nucleotidyltransferase
MKAEEIKVLNFGYHDRRSVLRLCLTGRIDTSVFSVDRKDNEAGTGKMTLTVEPYNGSNPFVKKISGFLGSHLKEDLVCAAVHGSLATGEEIPFSDFDGLLILKDQVFTDRERIQRVARTIRKSMRLLYNFDPPQTYFPVELFRLSRAIFPENAVELEIHLRSTEKIDWLSPFLSLTREVIKKAQKKNEHRNLYVLKGFLSQVMLLPALYYQAKNKIGIPKKMSFEYSSRDFTKDCWRIMDDIAKIRKEWQYTPSYFEKFLMTSTYPIIQLVKRRFAVRPEKKLLEAFNPTFYSCILKLVKEMKLNISENYS